MPNENTVLKLRSFKVNVHLNNCLMEKIKTIKGLEKNCMFLLITQPCFGKGKKNTENI